MIMMVIGMIAATTMVPGQKQSAPLLLLLSSCCCSCCCCCCFAFSILDLFCPLIEPLVTPNRAKQISIATYLLSNLHDGQQQQQQQQQQEL
jgi:hypothetical protein